MYLLFYGLRTWEISLLRNSWPQWGRQKEFLMRKIAGSQRSKVLVNSELEIYIEKISWKQQIVKCGLSKITKSTVIIFLTNAIPNSLNIASMVRPSFWKREYRFAKPKNHQCGGN